MVLDKVYKAEELQAKEPLRNSREDFPDLTSHIEAFSEDVGAEIDDIQGEVEEGVGQIFPEEEQDQGILVHSEIDSLVNSIDLSSLEEPIRENSLGALEIGAEHHKTRIETELEEERLTLPGEVKIEVDFDVMDTFTARLLRRQALQKATTVEDSIKEAIKLALLNGAEEGLGTAEMARRMADKIESLSREHADLVARTETMSASRKGSQALAESTDLIAGKEWIATNDNRVRPWHAAMDGVVVPKDELFTVPSGWSGPPHYQPSSYPRSVRVVGEDQPFNCRCDQTPVLREDMPDDLRSLSDMGLEFHGLTKRQIELWKEYSKASEDTFETFWKRVKDDYSVSEVAERYNMSNNTVLKYNEAV